jgi:hypothetical protein
MTSTSSYELYTESDIAQYTRTTLHLKYLQPAGEQRKVRYTITVNDTCCYVRRWSERDGGWLYTSSYELNTELDVPQYARAVLLIEYLRPAGEYRKVRHTIGVNDTSCYVRLWSERDGR